jgi:uncharacterized iron-regulated membrane protein
MASKSTMSNTMRIWHRYLGFFLAGIMTVYALSGVVMIFRDTDFLKQEKLIEKKLAPNLTADSVGKAIRIRDLKFDEEKGELMLFKQEAITKTTGETKYTVKSLPYVLDKLTKLHKANTKSPLYFLNIFFGVSLLFFVLSSFWMFLPKTTIFKKGMIFVAAGVIFTLIILFI